MLLRSRRLQRPGVKFNCNTVTGEIYLKATANDMIYN
jgi:hypothetical protein